MSTQTMSLSPAMLAALAVAYNEQLPKTTPSESIASEIARLKAENAAITANNATKRPYVAPVVPVESTAYVPNAKGDELLSWREMSTRYGGCRIRLIEGSDHALSDLIQAELAVNFSRWTRDPVALRRGFYVRSTRDRQTLY